MPSKVIPSQWSPIPIGDLENWNLDRTPDVPVMIRGTVYKNSASEWVYNDGQSRSYDAAFMRVSSVGTLAVSAHEVKQSDASSLRVSAVVDSGSVSAKSPDASAFRVSAFSDDASKMRVSALGVTVTTSPLSADSSSISAKQADAANLRVSAIIDYGSVSAKSAAADGLRISAFSNDAALMRVSALGVTASTTPLSADRDAVSAKQQDATNLRVSAFSNDGALFRVSSFVYDTEYSASPNVVVSARSVSPGSAMKGLLALTVSPDAAFNRCSAIGTQVVSAHEVKQSDATSLMVSARLTDDATINKFFGRVSAIQEGAGNQRTSAFSNDASLMRVSADLYCDTVGSMTAFRSISLSASQAIKATAGALYGYYLWNTTTVPQYIKFTNTSGAINVGTDVPVFMVMVPASAAANVEFSHGIKGFTAGIGVHATSAVADNATTAAAASAVGGTILYN